MFVSITAPLGALGVARRSLPAGVAMEFEQLATVLERCTPSIRLSGNGIEPVIAAVRDSPFVEDASLVTETAEWSVYQLTWKDTRPPLVQHVSEVDGVFLSAVAEGESWTVGLRFPDQAAATRFYRGNEDFEYPITVQKTRQIGSLERSPDDVLTAEQRDAILRAVEAGYFDVPRRTTLVELADDLGISDSAVSQRLRRGMLNILQSGAALPDTSSRPGFEEIQ